MTISKKQLFTRIFLLALKLSIFSCCLSIKANPEHTDTNQPTTNTFTIGKVSTNQTKHLNNLTPMAQYLAKNMEDLGITKGKVVIARNNSEMIELLKQGQVDLVTETPFSAMLYTERAPARAIALKWKKGVPSYYSVIFARKDSGLSSAKNLLGKRLVFEDPGSTSAFMLPMSSLLNAGYPLVKLSAPGDPVPDSMVGFVFSHSEQQTSDWVYQGKADAGAISNLDWNKPDHIPTRHKRDYHIIHRSAAIPRAIEVIRTDLNPDIQQRVQTLLFNAHKDPKATYALKRYQKTKRFEPITSETLGVLESIRKLIPFYSAADTE